MSLRAWGSLWAAGAYDRRALPGSNHPPCTKWPDLSAVGNARARGESQGSAARAPWRCACCPPALALALPDAQVLSTRRIPPLWRNTRSGPSLKEGHHGGCCSVTTPDSCARTKFVPAISSSLTDPSPRTSNALHHRSSRPYPSTPALQLAPHARRAPPAEPSPDALTTHPPGPRLPKLLATARVALSRTPSTAAASVDLRQTATQALITARRQGWLSTGVHS